MEFSLVETPNLNVFNDILKIKIILRWRWGSKICLSRINSKTGTFSPSLLFTFNLYYFLKTIIAFFCSFQEFYVVSIVGILSTVNECLQPPTKFVAANTSNSTKTK